MTFSDVKALLFDVQGTATDFHTTITRECTRLLSPRESWSAFVNSWRAAYVERIAGLRPGDGAWVSVDSVYRAALDALLEREGIGDTSGDDRLALTSAWRRLDPWPDTITGLTRLGQNFTLATLSNADVSAVVEMSRRASLPWHAVFTAEMAGAFKPDPRTYLMAARYLGHAPIEIAMVASHKYDIRAAKELGFRTVFVARPLEYGDPALADVEFSDEFDINATDFIDLADQLAR